MLWRSDGRSRAAFAFQRQARAGAHGCTVAVGSSLLGGRLENQEDPHENSVPR